MFVSMYGSMIKSCHFKFKFGLVMQFIIKIFCFFHFIYS